VSLADGRRLHRLGRQGAPVPDPEDWRPTLLTDRADLKQWIKPKTEQLELFAA
jgi:hypothetical protein